MTHPIGTNAKDPLLSVGPESGRELTRRFGQVAHGFSSGDVADAACNLLINVLRQSNPTRTQAEVAFNELFGRMKQILVDQYDGAGKRRSVFAHDQIVQVPKLDLRSNQ